MEILNGTQKGLWNLLEDMLVVSWLCPRDDEEGKLAIQKDIVAIEQSMRPLLRKHYVATEQDVYWFVQQGTIAGGEQAR